MNNETRELVIELHNKLRQVLRHDLFLRSAETKDFAAMTVVKIKKLEAEISALLVAIGIDPKSDTLITPVMSAQSAPWWDDEGAQ